MKTRDLKSLSETIASVVDPIDKERAQMLQEGFLNSLTEKARQIASKEMEDEGEEEEDEDEMEDEGEEEEKPTSKKKKAKMDEAYPTTYVPEPKPVKPKKKLSDYRSKPYPKLTNEDIELAEKAAPGYEDWASDPKVKASFKKQYGKRWKEVMYGHSWNLAKQENKLGLDEEEQLDELTDALISRARNKAILRGPEKRGFVKKATKRLQSSGAMAPRPSTSTERDSQWNKAFNEETDLDEAVSAKRMRIIRKYVKGNKRVPEHLKDYMERSFKKKRFKDKQLSDGRGAVGALETRMRRKSAALRARGIEPKGVAPGYLEEGILKKLRRAKGAAYAAMQKGEGDKYAKLHGVASGLESRYKASMARRGEATQETVRGAGSRLSKKGKYTLKAGKLATQHDNAISRFRTKVRTAELFGRETDKGAKRERQQAQAKFRMDARHGDFGYNDIITPEIKKAGLRARYNYEKKFGRLKGK